MKKRLWKTLVALSRLTVLTLVALSMVASIAFPSVTIRVPAIIPVERAVVSGQHQLLPATPEADESTGKMGTGRKQQSAPILVAVLSAAQKTDDGCQRRAVISADQTVLVHSASHDHYLRQTTSIARVSVKVAQQYTLVGAKPSGTM